MTVGIRAGIEKVQSQSYGRQSRLCGCQSQEWMAARAKRWLSEQKSLLYWGRVRLQQGGQRTELPLIETRE